MRVLRGVEREAGVPPELLTSAHLILSKEAPKVQTSQCSANTGLVEQNATASELSVTALGVFSRKTEHGLRCFCCLYRAFPEAKKSRKADEEMTPPPHPTHIEYLNKNALLIFRDASVSHT